MAIFNQPFLSGGFPSMNRAAGAVGGWVELGRTTLGADGDTISVSSLDNKRYYMILHNPLASGTIDSLLTFNSDTGSNYSESRNNNGGTDGTATSQSDILITTDETTPNFGVYYVANLSSNEKLVQGWTARQSTASAATAPNRWENTGKWANTSNPISTITMSNGRSGDFASGSETVVLGWDPADTHTNNFWEELASVSGSDDVGDDFDTGTFTAKKYLWVQGWFKSDQGASTVNLRMRLGNSTVDTGSNYAYRVSESGGTDSTVTSTDRISPMGGASMNANDEAIFFSGFIVNNASNEKLLIEHNVDTFGGTGAAIAPRRSEVVGKWTNTSNQCNIIGFTNVGTGNITYRDVRVWGAD